MKLSIKTIIISVLVVLAATAGIGGISLVSSLEDHTDNTNPQIIEENISLESLLLYQAVEAMDDVSNTGKIEISLTEYEMNQIFYAVSQEIDIPDVKIRSMYVEFQNDSYKLFIPIEVMNIETLVSCDLALKEKNHVISINLSNIKIGKLNKGAINTALGMVENAIIKELSNYYLTTTIQNGEISASISREDLKKAIDEATSEDPLHDIIIVAYNVLMLQTDAVKFNISSPKHFAITIDLIRFGGFKSTTFDSYERDMNQYISSGIVNESNINEVSKCYVNGYKYLTNSERYVVESAFAKTSYASSIINRAGYYGDRGDPTTEMEKVVRACFSSYFNDLLKVLSPDLWGILFPITAIAKKIVEVSNFFKDTYVFGITEESAIQGYIDALPIRGTVIPIISDISKKSSYIIIESTDLNILDQGLELIVYVNVNGCVVPVTIEMGINNPYITNLVFGVKKVTIGESALTNESVVLMCSYIDSLFSLSFMNISGTQIKVSVSALTKEALNSSFSQSIFDRILSCFYVTCAKDDCIKVKIDVPVMVASADDLAKDLVNECLNIFK